nr:hypothetical protein XF16B_85720 [Bradyrhizobium diazoefficiens]
MRYWRGSLSDRDIQPHSGAKSREAPMKIDLPGEFSHYAQMTSSAQQFYKEAAACREEASRSLNAVDREGWAKLARE